MVVVDGGGGGGGGGGGYFEAFFLSFVCSYRPFFIAAQAKCTPGANLILMIVINSY